MEVLDPEHSGINLFDDNWKIYSRNSGMTGHKIASGAIVAVSYTHLDVYKRQVRSLRTGELMTPLTGSPVWLSGPATEKGREGFSGRAADTEAADGMESCLCKV